MPTYLSFSCNAFAVMGSSSYDTRNYFICNFVACANTTLFIDGCNSNCAGDTYYRLYDADYNILVQNNDGADVENCGTCSQILYVTKPDSKCQVYELDQGCNIELGCSGTTTISMSGTGVAGHFLAPTNNFVFASLFALIAIIIFLTFWGNYIYYNLIVPFYAITKNVIKK